ncbi:hypothetical protein P691DRAFT_668094 [Macrolepiota fuliginosa MF-IS2]|uniref:Uncharacterized protein n=1 Tax=Macrolepiota fuliginosa MF-IS2 TaxID=1400762 RepID=A0A9P5XD07_9AGAR|nr:hypothetical protein P691DRAFT_668094 [Macrolepiota fuliginosa MF-IS2]
MPSPQPTSAQPRASTEMSVMNTSVTQKCQEQEQQCKHKNGVARLRGGGAGKDCFLGMIGCFLCCECCEGCCECIADIVCCPCEMCC